MTTPDDYRYAKSHIRAAIDHLKLAQHYIGAGEPNDCVKSTVDSVRGELEEAHSYALDESLKPFVPRPAPYTCPQCGLDPNGDAIHTLTHHTFPPLSVADAQAVLRGDIPLKGI